MGSSAEITADLIAMMDNECIFQKHIIDGYSYFFEEVLKDRNKEYELRHDIASALGVNINDVIIVGSAKMGYSVKSEKFVKFDEKFRNSSLARNKSDVDIAIVNRKLFDREAELIFQLSRHFSIDWLAEYWLYNVYYPDEKTVKMNGIDSIFGSYVKYLARGWLRADFMPNMYLGELVWKTVTDRWAKIIERKISIGVYSDWYYLKHYQMDNLEVLRSKIFRLEIDNV